MGGYTSAGSVLSRSVRKTLTFTGASGLGQAASNAVFFTVTGEVLILSIIPFCTTGLTEAAGTATVSLGVVGSTALFIAATNSVDIDTNEFWVDTAPDPNGIVLPAALKDVVITDNIVVAAATQDTNGGVLRIDLVYLALSPGSSVVAA